jgi:hypothetical protein
MKKGAVMNKTIRNLSIIILVFGIIALIMGIVYVYEGVSKKAWLADTMRQENITLSALGITGSKANEIIDSAETAQIAADTVRTHRHSIAPSYEELMGTGKFDPTNPKHLTYAQALNIENYLYLSVLGFGVATMAVTTGCYMIVTGLALGVIGFVLFRVAKT